jgi:hypothetical protein
MERHAETLLGRPSLLDELLDGEQASADDGELRLRRRRRGRQQRFRGEFIGSDRGDAGNNADSSADLLVLRMHAGVLEVNGAA